LLRHEVDRFRRRELRCDRQVALVFAVRCVHDHDELPLADVLDRLLDRGEGALALDLHQEDGSPGRSRATYFARTSASSLTASPASRPPRVVTSSVCCTSATAK